MELNHRKNLHYKNSGNNIWNVLSYSYRELFLIENYKYQKEDYTMSEKRNTWQKQVIYSVIKELKTHPTVQSLIDELVSFHTRIPSHRWAWRRTAISSYCHTT